MIREAREIDFIWEAEEAEPPDSRVHEFVNDLFDRLNLDGAELSILVTRDDHMRELNATYRGKDRTTDVLSFPGGGPLPDGSHHLGDVVISHDQLVRQAAELGQSVARELRFLILHGVLHLLGHDHETDDGEMMALQSSLKRELATYFF
ncbi:rRNA maturation RNase YbeY [Sulfidibacter corallicola]|uniref:Endoribonuclease YbeY n=1 Tax=Sulfidibacter corallicola TaxID=2818388 RepID=A0A8A4U063_SULCO|nr:rRNA maturation RNase YbeY [Sulfidibacter corallicola]QTD52135.1 rRNA maturation RNase YbeY [Sulfidibacter corallicola]